MNPQLQTVIDEFEGARQRLQRLAMTLTESQWSERADPARWSSAECVAHVNLTSAAFVPIIREGFARASRIAGAAPRRYRRDPVGWLLWKSTGPPVRFRVPTTAAFVPKAADGPGRLIAEFDRLQDDQIACVREADGLSLERIKVISPFNARVKYNLFAALTILPRHQHRHLWQAEQRLEARR